MTYTIWNASLAAVVPSHRSRESSVNASCHVEKNARPTSTKKKKKHQTPSAASMRSASVGALISPFFASYSLTSSSACITA